MAIGTGINRLLIIGGGGGGTSGLSTFNYAFTANQSTFTDSRLIGANLVAIAGRNIMFTNEGLNFNPATGTLTRQFYADDTITFFYTK